MLKLQTTKLVPLPKVVRKAPDPYTFSIALISANAFHFNMKRKENEFFTTSLYEINQVLDWSEEDSDNADLVDNRLPPEYYAFYDVFSKTAADQLPKH